MTFTPDTKDWTWVLERPCEECEFDAASFAREDVGRIIRENAAQWQRVLAAPDVTVRPNVEKWSPLEYGCHVRDVHRVMIGRLELMLGEDDPAFPNWDQDATALDDAYGMQIPAQVATELDAAAAEIADRFDAVSSEQWDRPGTRSNGSRFTVETLARYAVHDVSHHLVDVPAV